MKSNCGDKCLCRTAKPGKIMPQPPHEPNSGKLDSQIFIGKKDPQEVARKKKKKKKKKKASFNLKQYRESLKKD
jgi:hypothetical protein